MNEIKLSRRQRELLALLALGDSNCTIAEKLGIAEHTVKVHLYRLFRRLGVANRGQAARAWSELQDSAADAKAAAVDVELARLRLANTSLIAALEWVLLNPGSVSTGSVVAGALAMAKGGAA